MNCSLAIATVLITAPAAEVQTPARVEASVSSTATSTQFDEVIAQARGLKATVDLWISGQDYRASGFIGGEDFTSFGARIGQLAELNMAHHHRLRTAGTDGDLTCILRGIGEDLPKKLEAIQAAPDDDERALALTEMAYLLNDNVEVILAPPPNP